MHSSRDLHVGLGGGIGGGGGAVGGYFLLITACKFFGDIGYSPGHEETLGVAACMWNIF